MDESGTLRAVGRKPLVSEDGDTLKATSVKLWERQIAWINSRENGNAWLRDVIARAIRREQGKPPAKRRRKLS
jgi:hypothetical protein